MTGIKELYSSETCHYPDWLAPKCRFPSWSPELAAQALHQQHPAPLQGHRVLQSLILLQQQFGSVTAPMQSWLSDQSGVHVADIRSLIEFYSFLTGTPPVSWTLRFAANIIEYHAGLDAVLQQVRQRLAGHDVMIETTSCIGLSDRPLAVLVNGFPITGLNADNCAEFCDLIVADTPLQNWPAHWREVDNHIHVTGPLTDHDYQARAALHRARTRSADHLIANIEQAGLRGLGGAGFAAATKLKQVREQQESVKYIICNADEGEPGTFKDRYFLSCQPDQLIEGMLIAALATGASRGFIYLRGEYQYLYPLLLARLQTWRDLGELNQQFDIEIHLGAGAYICGEESALIESLMGKRGIPAAKPPYPAVHGLFGKPTLVHNVETLVAMTRIMQLDSQAFTQLGTADSKGTRLHSVSGDCARPGLYELDQGTPLQTLLDLCGASDAHWVQVGGPSGHLLDQTGFQQPLDFENAGHGGAIMVFNSSRSLQQITTNFSHFFRHESCGFCTPCRAGTVALCHLLERYEQQPERQRETLAHMQELGKLMQHTSHCGLGKTAALPVLDLIRLQHPGESLP